MMNIDHLSEEELINLNQRIVERLKVLEQMKALQSMVKLHIGQRVCFDPDGRMRTGAIVKFNHKTVVVRTDDQHQWKVAPHYLKPLVEGEATQVHHVTTISSRQNPKR
jgi:hypothetical protein